MKRKELWRKLSWMLAAGLVISNPAYLHAKETEEAPVQTEQKVSETEEMADEPTETETAAQAETTQTEEASEEDTGNQEPESAMTEPETDRQTEKETTEEEEEEKRKKPSQISDTEADTEAADGQRQESGGEPESRETERESEKEPSNSQLISGQTIYQVEKIEEDFRFVTVEGEIAAAREDLKIYEEQDENSRAVGSLQEDGVCYVLKQEEGWAYVESGVVRGFVRADRLLLGAQAKQRLAAIQGKGSYMSLAFPVDHLKKPADSSDEGFMSYTVNVETLEELEYTEDWSSLDYARPLVDPIENRALAYTRTTTRETVAGKIYAIAQKADVTVYASLEPDEAKAAGILERGALCYILADEESDMIYIESGDVRGFVRADQMLTGEKAEEMVKEQGEETFALAEEKMEPEENPVLHYTLTSIKEGRISSAIRASMVKFATSFIGNPYVWGGTSLTQGADCSGFVQSIYAQYGYSIPRVAADQAQYGKKIRVSDAQPGDLIFYAKGGEIYHVVMYIGNGKVVEAAGTGIGIITANVNTEGAVWATSIISDEDEEIIRKVNRKSAAYVMADEEDIGEYLGKFKLTSYCTCAVCCGQWANGVTASGAMPTEGRTVAMAGVPFGTRLVIGGQIYVVEDRGTPYGHVDIFKNLHEECSQFGVQYADVYLAK